MNLYTFEEITIKAVNANTENIKQTNSRVNHNSHDIDHNFKSFCLFKTDVEKRRKENDTTLSSLQNELASQKHDLKAEIDKLWKWFSAAKAGIAKQAALHKSEVQKLEKSVEQLTAQFQEFKQATSRRCKNCGSNFTPLRVHHKKCKPCTIAKSTIPCKKCKQLFAQKHHNHKYCDACYN